MTRAASELCSRKFNGDHELRRLHPEYYQIEKSEGCDDKHWLL
jgi:hypothetical protein